jgi:hypothetical protein
MTAADGVEGAFAWWERRRLAYNFALAAAGWAAYGATIGLYAAFGRSLWPIWQAALAMTLALGTAFLILMFAANVCFLIGPALESWLRPADPARYRARAWPLGLWGSVALPFAFPLINLALLIGMTAH